MRQSASSNHGLQFALLLLLTVVMLPCDASPGDPVADGCDLTVTKSMSADSLVAGQTATAVITVTNVGSQPCPGPTTVDDHWTPVGALTILSASGPGWTWTTGSMAVYAGPIPAGASVTVTYVFNVGAAAPHGASLSNCATVSARADSNSRNNEHCVKAAILPRPPGGIGTPLPCCGDSMWRQREVSATDPRPSARASASMAFHAKTETCVLFGGLASTAPGYLGDTWEWDGADWTPEIGSAAPPARADLAMAYDEGNERVLMFGGHDATNVFGDTWAWVNGWNEVQVPGIKPSARYGHAMAYDAANKRVVMFGGMGPGSTLLGDTWEWNGIQWTLRSSGGPAPRHAFGLAYDSSRSRVVLFGGLTANGPVADLWEWDGSTWTQRPATGPAPRYGHSMAYDTACGRVLVCAGGNGPNGPSVPPWAWDGSGWTALEGGDGARTNAAVAYDTVRHRLVEFGGVDSSWAPGTPMTVRDDVWELGCACEDEEVDRDENGNETSPPDDPSEDVDVDETQGPVSTLYPDLDTSLATWIDHLPCNPTIGDDPLTPEDLAPDWTDADLEALGIDNVEQFLAQMQSDEEAIAAVDATERDPFPKAPSLAGPYRPPASPHCTPKGGKYVFGGRDLVFVHGFSPEAIEARLVCEYAENPGVFAKWPDDRTAFYDDGYWKGRAEEYWSAHIEHYLTSRNIKNRYLIVCFASTQRLKFAAQAVLAQIADAMQTGKGVKDPTTATPELNFGTPSYVVIAHSTGGLVTDVAMRAAQVHPNLGVGFVQKHCKAHIALHCAFRGSRLATAAVALGGFAQPHLVNPFHCELTKLLLKGLKKWTGPLPCGEFGCLPPPNILTPLAQSILVDLVPLVAQGRWGSYVEHTPVPTLTIAGAFARYDSVPRNVVKHLLLPGLDDGVLPLESQLANKNPPPVLFNWPGGFIADPLPPRLLDKGLVVGPSSGGSALPAKSATRALGYFADQVLDYRRFPPFVTSLIAPRTSAGAVCTQTRDHTPWGMIQAVLLPIPGVMLRHKSHFSLIQDASDHIPVMWPSDAEGEIMALDEECWAVTDPDVFINSRPMPHAFDSQSVLSKSWIPPSDYSVRGKFRCGKPKKATPANCEKRPKWKWRRQYVRLHDWERLTPMDYAYDHVLHDMVNACSGGAEPVDGRLCVRKFLDKNGNGEQEDGEPGLTGWVFQVKDSDGAVVGTITTGPEVSCITLPPGTYTVVEELRAGYKATTPTVQTKVVTSGAPTYATFGNQWLDIKPSADGELCVRKFLDKNGNGVLEDGEPLIPGWKFQVKDSTGTVVKTITTEPEEGCIKLRAGTYTVVEEPREGYKPTTPTTQVKVVAPGQTTHVTFGNQWIDIKPPEVGEVCVRKFLDENGNGVRDAGERGLADWRFEVRDERGGVAATLSADAEGVACISLRPGSYTVSELPQPGYTATTATSQRVVVQGGRRLDVSFGNRRAVSVGRLCIRKFLDGNGNGAQDANEPGLAGWTFTVTDSSKRTTTMTTDARGDACVDVPAGPYNVRETPMRGWTATTSDTQTVVVAPGKTTNVGFGNRRLVESGTLCVRKFEDLNANGVQDRNEPGLAGWTFTVTDARGAVVATVTTGPQGSASTNLPAGKYPVVEVPQRGWTATTPTTQSVVVTPGRTTRVAFGNRGEGGGGGGGSTPAGGLVVHAEGIGFKPIEGLLGRLVLRQGRLGSIAIAPGGTITVGREQIAVADLASISFTWSGVGPQRSPTATILTQQGRKLPWPPGGGPITSISLHVDVPGGAPRAYEWTAGQAGRRPTELMIVGPFKPTK